VNANEGCAVLDLAAGIRNRQPDTSWKVPSNQLQSFSSKAEVSKDFSYTLIGKFYGLGDVSHRQETGGKPRAVGWHNHGGAWLMKAVSIHGVSARWA